MGGAVAVKLPVAGRGTTAEPVRRRAVGLGDIQRRTCPVHNQARDVDHALKDIAITHGGTDEDEAVAYLRCLSADKPGVRDVY